MYSINKFYIETFEEIDDTSNISSILKYIHDRVKKISQLITRIDFFPIYN